MVSKMPSLEDRKLAVPFLKLLRDGFGRDINVLKRIAQNGSFLLVTDIFDFDQQFGLCRNAKGGVRCRIGVDCVVKTAHKEFEALCLLVDLPACYSTSDFEDTGGLLTKAPMERSKKSKNWKSGGVLY